MMNYIPLFNFIKSYNRRNHKWLQVEVIQVKEVKLYVEGHCNSMNEQKLGYYIMVLEYKSIRKKFRNDFDKTTANRMIIQGLIDGIKMLKEPCKIDAYMKTPIGLVKLKKYDDNSPKARKRDLLHKLVDSIIQAGHQVEYHIDVHGEKITPVIKRMV